MAYFVSLPFAEDQYLDPEFVGGNLDNVIMMRVHKIRPDHDIEVNLQSCFTYHVRVPPDLLGSMPKRIVVNSTNDYLPDFGLAPWGGWSLVSQAFVDIVERLEPTAHQFLPIVETVDEKGREVEKRFLLMNILHQLNTVYVERSSVAFHERTVAELNNVVVRTMLLVPPQILTLKKDLAARHHLWHGTTEDIYQVFFSEALHDAVLAAGLSPLEYFHAEEV